MLDYFLIPCEDLHNDKAIAMLLGQSQNLLDAFFSYFLNALPMNSFYINSQSLLIIKPFVYKFITREMIYFLKRIEISNCFIRNISINSLDISDFLRIFIICIILTVVENSSVQLFLYYFG